MVPAQRITLLSFDPDLGNSRRPAGSDRNRQPSAGQGTGGYQARYFLVDRIRCGDHTDGRPLVFRDCNPVTSYTDYHFRDLDLLDLTFAGHRR